MHVALLLSTLALVVPALLPLPAWAYRDYLSAEQKAQLEKIQTVLVEAIALTDKGTADAVVRGSCITEWVNWAIR